MGVEAEVVVALVAVVVVLEQHPAMAVAVGMERQLLLDLAVVGLVTAMDVSICSQPVGFHRICCWPLFSAPGPAHLLKGSAACCCSVKVLIGISQRLVSTT